MSEHEQGQVAASAAAVYEQFFVPALFAEWPPRLLAAAGVEAGDRVLDVACGTGVVSREAARLVGDEGVVVGLDINDGMLAVAKEHSDAVTWRLGAAESLPFAADTFNRVVSQFGLMFFQDRTTAISEMLRVAMPGGSIAVAVWASLADVPGYAAVADMLNDMFGPRVAASIEVPYSLGDTDALRAMFTLAGADNVTVTTVPGKSRFPSIDAWVYTDIKGWTLADVIDDAGYERLKVEAATRLAEFELDDGSVEFDSPAHIVTVST